MRCSFAWTLPVVLRLVAGHLAKADQTSHCHCVKVILTLRIVMGWFAPASLEAAMSANRF